MLADTRLCGAVLMDPYAYEAPGSKLSRFAERARNPDRWVEKISKLTSRSDSDDSPLMSDVDGQIQKDTNIYAMDADRGAPPAE